MRKSIVVVCLAALSSLVAGCMPNGEGFAFSPRSYAYYPSIGPGPSAEVPASHAK